MTKYPRKPDWLRVRLPGGDRHHQIKRQLRSRSLHTVCEEAKCPNLGECWQSGTATIMIMGDICTRGCRFCSVMSGQPKALDPFEPQKCAETVAAMKLDYVVITSVDRDDLTDFGSTHFAAVIERIRLQHSHCLIEVLTPDFQNNHDAINRVVDAGPDVFAHNLETVSRLSPSVRDRRAGYRKSLQVLRLAKQIAPEMLTKSSLMLGLGEHEHEIIEAMDDMRDAGVEILTIGQYLRPSRKQASVKEYVEPQAFQHYGAIARAKGFRYAASGPLVRSSYKAGEYFIGSIANRGRSFDSAFSV